MQMTKEEASSGFGERGLDTRLGGERRRQETWLNDNASSPQEAQETLNTCNVPYRTYGRSSCLQESAEHSSNFLAACFFSPSLQGQKKEEEEPQSESDVSNHAHFFSAHAYLGTTMDRERRNAAWWKRASKKPMGGRGRKETFTSSPSCSKERKE